MKSFEKTNLALKDLESIFRCENCSKALHQPMVVGGTCEHILCPSCVSSMKDHCPKCNTRSIPKERHTITQFSGVLSVIRRLINLTGLTNYSEEEHENVPVQAEIVEEILPSQPLLIKEVIPEKPSSESEKFHVEEVTPPISIVHKERQPRPVKEVRPKFSVKRKKSPVEHNPSALPNVRHLPKRFKMTGGTSPSRSVTPCGKSSQREHRNKKGETKLHEAVINGKLDQVKYLLTQCDPPYSVNVTDYNGWTPLHEAVNHGYKEIAELLLNHGALINLPAGDDKETPLMDAVACNKVDCVILLRQYGADVTMRNLMGQTAEDLAMGKATLLSALKTAPIPSKIAQNAQFYCKKLVTVEPPSKKSIKILISGQLPKELREKVEQVCNLSDDADFVDATADVVTHFITLATIVRPPGVNKSLLLAPRTMKYLLGILHGAWVVSADWLDACLKAGFIVDEEEFEIDSCLGMEELANSQQLLQQSIPKYARLQKSQGLPGLFSGCQFYFKGPFESSKIDIKDLKNLVLKGGGIIHSRELKPSNIDSFSWTAPFHARHGSNLENCCFYVIYDPECKQNKRSLYDTPRIKSMPHSWILDCITQYKLT